jgi:uncharacterized protein YjbI with pentapeptide repeats
MAGYWSVDATDDDAFRPVENLMAGAAGGLFGLVVGFGVAAASALCQRIRRLLVARFRQAPGFALSADARCRRLSGVLAAPLAGLLLAGSGLLPVRVTRAGLWLARHHGQGADLRGAVLYATDLTNVDLRDADLQGADLHDARLRGATLWSTCLAGADLRHADLRGVSGVSVNLHSASLDGADLAGATLTGADLSDTRLTSTRLAGAIYDPRTRWPAGFDPRQRGAIRLQPGVKLHGANLRNADLRHEDLHGADLSGANLTGVQLNGADLRGASLRAATLVDGQAEWYENLDLSGADLRAADLTGVSMDDETVTLTGALYDSRTRWPAGVDPHQLGAILAEGLTPGLRGGHSQR